MNLKPCTADLFPSEMLYSPVYSLSHIYEILLYTTILNKVDWKKNPYVKIFTGSRRDKQVKALYYNKCYDRNKK